MLHSYSLSIRIMQGQAAFASHSLKGKERKRKEGEREGKEGEVKKGRIQIAPL